MAVDRGAVGECILCVYFNNRFFSVINYVDYTGAL